MTTAPVVRCALTELPAAMCAHCRPPAEPAPAPEPGRPAPTPRVRRQARARLADALQPGDWTRDARCAHSSMDPDLWADDGETSATADAKRTCRSCPVRQTCLDEALALEGDAPARRRYGVWGGMTPTERRAEYLRRQRRTIAAAAAAGGGVR